MTLPILNPVISKNLLGDNYLCFDLEYNGEIVPFNILLSKLDEMKVVYRTVLNTCPFCHQKEKIFCSYFEDKKSLLSEWKNHPDIRFLLLHSNKRNE